MLIIVLFLVLTLFMFTRENFIKCKNNEFTLVDNICCQNYIKDQKALENLKPKSLKSGYKDIPGKNPGYCTKMMTPEK